MENWTGAERAVAVRAFYKNGDSATAAQRTFRQHYLLGRHGRVPSAHAITTWVRNFEETGSALKKKPPGGIPTVRTPENIATARAAIERSPRRSVRQHASSLGIKRRSLQRILHELDFHPYKLQIVQLLNERDPASRMEFSIQILAKINEDANFLGNLWISDEAHFHLNGFVNKQNFRYWAQDNPCEFHQRPLHSAKVTIWCAVSCHGVIGPYFFERDDGSAVTVTSARYVEMLQTFFTPRLYELNLNVENMWFQQDGATSHTARQSMAAVRQLFGTRIISRNGDIAWPARSPDLSVCDFFLWGYLKGKVYRTRPATIHELKENIENEITAIPQDLLHRAFQSFRNRLVECERRMGAHLSDVIFKK